MGAMCAPAVMSTSSTPSWRASRTPHACMDSPRTRSGNSAVASKHGHAEALTGERVGERGAGDAPADHHDISL